MWITPIYVSPTLIGMEISIYDAVVTIHSPISNTNKYFDSFLLTVDSKKSETLKKLAQTKHAFDTCRHY